MTRAAEPLKAITARIAHVCSLCGGKIEPGETYTRRFRWRPKNRGYYIKKCNPCVERATA